MRSFSAVSRSLLLFAALAGICPYGWSQEVTASITGTVTDPRGAAVPGAQVTATSQERGQTYNVLTNDTGLYRISQLPVGSYTLKVEKSGFSSASYPAFVLTLNQVARIDVAMKVGQTSETVEVSAAAPVLATETTQVDTIMNSVTNDNLPLASRNYVQLTLLAPGAVSTDPSSFNNGNNTGGYGGRPLINGNREQANNFMLDGMDNNQVSDNLLGYTPAPDAIQEFNLITSNAPAEFGNFEGGIVNATIKSGTNSFHGDIWEFFRNDVLNAHNWADKLVTPALDKAKVRWNMFGGTVGGPIIKNRLFFFADYQGQRFDIPSSQTQNTVFTAAERGGDFGALCQGGFVNGVCQGAGQLYNPCASFTAPCTPSSTPAAVRKPFPNNIIPAVMISPVAANLFKSNLYPAPVNTQTQNNAVNTVNSAQNVDQGDLKIDFRASQKDNISYRFTRAYQNNPSVNSQVLLSNGYSTTPIYNTVGDWTRTIGVNLVNDARIGWSHVTLNSGNSWASSVGQFGNTLGIGNGNPASLDGLLALNFTHTAVSNLGAAEQTQSFDDHVWQFEDGLSWSHGRHNFKFGGQLWNQNIKTFYAGNNGQLGLMDFDGRFTSPAVGSSGGDGGADFVLGLDYQYGRGVSSGKTWQQVSNVIGAYVQDTWRITDQLTLNLGLRYDAHTPWTESNDQQANYNIATGNIDLAGKNGASRALYNGFYGGRDFQPRIGFAWTPTALGGHTVFRGAFTISSYLEGTGTNLRLTLNPPFTPAEINAVYNNVALPLTNSSDGIVGSGSSASCAAPAYACYAQSFLRVWDPNVQPAIADQWNATVQHQFAGNTTVQVGYVGQKGTHLMVPFDFAQRVLLSDGTTAPSPYFAKNPTLYAVLGNPAEGGEGATVSGTKSNGNMTYNALQAVLQQQASHGLQYQVSYTFSKCMSDSTGYYGAWNNALSASAYWQNVYDQRSEWAPCYYDATHVLSSYAVYDLPFGRGKMVASNINKAVDQVIGGWAVSPIVSFRTGWPLPVYGAQDNSGTFGRGARANCNGLPSITKTSIPGVGVQWFTNSGQFTQPAPGTFGNCSPQLDGLRSPRYTDVDMSVHKNFPITERFKLQFRTDFINAFNHTQFNAPNMGLGPTMGQITGAQPPRNIQLALKLYY
ncbi:TonB-dependent receptor [Occallatibacter riparius]|uniref:TonB-dependent receptor n=1 Tax=Occallatibacter riparius TaxID=1002689 RepID=A0A9J7BMH8_9BACT|nr:TonB-dependent receptor [Occallatibacter riparius]UWZ83697.1 TonB-dependent receptor [Occallatibacter riparius]